MSDMKRLFWLAVGCLCLPFLVGCGLFGRNNDVDQGVAFPPMAESPPTSESSLPKPMVLSVTETAEQDSPTPTAAPPTPLPPTAVPQANQPLPTATTTQPQVLSFTAETIDNNPGRTITFSWQSSGGKFARIYNGANGSMRFPAYWDVPLNGTFIVDIPDTRRSNPRFELFIYADEGETAYATAFVEILWPCSLPYFFDHNPIICAQTEATYTTAVEQHFQGGRMVWLQELDWIYVLYDEVVPDGGQGGDLQWERYNNGWTEELAEFDLSTVPPAGYYAPVRGFGLVWRENQSVQDRLGWALAPEISYDGAWQLQPPDTDDPGGGTIFFQLEDSQIARLSGFDVWGWLWMLFEPFS